MRYSCYCEPTNTIWELYYQKVNVRPQANSLWAVEDKDFFAGTPLAKLGRQNTRTGILGVTEIKTASF